jgi:DNA topoisomerase-1
MSSDEDSLLTTVAGANGKSHVTVNGNGHSNGDAYDSPMSEDDMPLVCVPLVHYML